MTRASDPRPLVAAASLAFLGACAFGPPIPADVRLGALGLEVLADDATTADERQSVADAAAWWTACGRPVYVLAPEDGHELETRTVRFVADVSAICEEPRDVACAGGSGIIVEHLPQITPELLRVVLAHEEGHLLGYGHTAGGIMSSPPIFSALDGAPCLPSQRSE